MNIYLIVAINTFSLSIIAIGINWIFNPDNLVVILMWLLGVISINSLAFFQDNLIQKTQEELRQRNSSINEKFITTLEYKQTNDKKIAELLEEKAHLNRSLDDIRLKINDLEASQLPSLVRSGLVQYAQNYVRDFKIQNRRSFGDFIREFVLTSEPGEEIKVCGIDWVELFGEAISATSEIYEDVLSRPQTLIKVILLHPGARSGLEKRLSEYLMEVNGKPKYIEDHNYRIPGKIVGSVRMMAEYHKRYPSRFQYRFTDTIPTACWVMNSKKIVFYLYFRSHKGWDSPVFIANNTEEGIYSYFKDYFNFLWETPMSVLSDEDWEKRRQDISHILTTFDSLIENACSGEDHKHCPFK